MRRRSSTPCLLVLHLSSEPATAPATASAQLYLCFGDAATRSPHLHPHPCQNPSDLTNWVRQFPQTPWALLIDQSEEFFWNDTIPAVRGAAQRALVRKCLNHHAQGNPLRCVEVQARIDTQAHSPLHRRALADVAATAKRRVLVHALGSSEQWLPWLQALDEQGARIRGVYSPGLLTQQALRALHTARASTRVNAAHADDFTVLVTPHPKGLRQSVLLRGHLRLSRLALHEEADAGGWLQAVGQETARLREYLQGATAQEAPLGSEPLCGRIHVVLPQSLQHLDNQTLETLAGLREPKREPKQPAQAAHERYQDQYLWHRHAHPAKLYVQALAREQPALQLAPKPYRQRDLSARITQALGWLGVMGLLICTAVGLWLTYTAYAHQAQIAALRTQAQATRARYAAIAQGFAPSPLSASELLKMQQQWEQWQAWQKKDERQQHALPLPLPQALAQLGRVLQDHPQIVAQELLWLGHGQAVDLARLEGMSTDTNAGPCHLIVRGEVQGIAAQELRKTRDVMQSFLSALAKKTPLRVQATRWPLDLRSSTPLHTRPPASQTAPQAFEVQLCP